VDDEEEGLISDIGGLSSRSEESVGVRSLVGREGEGVGESIK
jgi:hypothetical protein